MKYRFVVEDEVLDLFMRLSTRRRERLFSIFQSLADSAPLSPEMDHRDSVGRPIYRREFNGWTVWFWHDGPVHEVRIVDIEARSRR